MGDGDSSTLDFTGEASSERNAGGVPLWRAILLLRMQQHVLQTADGSSSGSEAGSRLLMGLRGSRTLPEVEKHLVDLAEADPQLQMPPSLEAAW